VVLLRGRKKKAWARDWRPFFIQSGSQTDCWKKNDDGGRNKDAYSLIDAGAVLNRDHNDLLKHSDLDLDCVTVVRPPGHADCREFVEE